MKKIKGMISVLTVSLLCITLFAGCSTESSNATNTSTDKKAILVVSFGTSYNDSRDITIGAIEKAIEKNFSDYEVRRAFTSQIIINKLKERDNIEIDNVEEALDKLVADGINTLIVQPTHIMSGYEYDDLATAIEEYKDKFDIVAIGAPLLTSDEDYAKVIEIITAETSSYRNEETAIIFM